MRVWIRGGTRIAALALVAGVGGVAHAADAQGCFTPVGGIDGVDPDITRVGNGSYGGVNDARWNGGFGYGWETGGLGEGEFKAISDGNKIFVSWRHLILKNEIAAYEGVQVGFGYTPSGSSNQVSQIIRVNFGLPGSTITTADTPDPVDHTFHGRSPAAVQLLYKIGTGPTKTWATVDTSKNGALKWVYDATSMFVFSDAKLVTTQNPNGLYYVVQMAIPIKSAPEADPSVSGNKWLTPGVYVTPGAACTTNADCSAPQTCDSTQHCTGQPIPYWADVLQALDPNTNTVVFRSWPDPGLSNPTTPNYTAQNRDLNGPNNSTIGTPDPAHWSTMQSGLPSNGTCAGQGINFRNTDIINTTATSLMKWDGNLLAYSIVGGKVTPTQNNFQVNVNNSSTTSYTPSDISAAFSIAPYGSQAGARTAAWAPLYDNGNTIACTTVNGAQVCSTVAGTQITAKNSSAAATNGTFSLATDPAMGYWAPHSSYLCALVDQSGTPYNKYADFVNTKYCTGAPWLPAQQDPNVSTLFWDGLPFHTCMQVELSTNGQHSGGVTFANKSAFRNMYTVPASTYREQAIIDTRGLAQIPGAAGHMIYLFTETRNMPASEPADNGGGGSGGSGGGGGGGGIPISSPRTFVEEGGGPTYNQLSQTMPTFAVHTYWDTGKTTVINHQRVSVLEPMTSYGNFVTHDYANEGAIYGWDAHLEGVQQVGPNTYRIWIPNEGRVSVTTNITAKPSPSCTGTANMDVTQLLQSLAPALVQKGDLAQDLNNFLNSLAIQCADLNTFLKAVGAINWGVWNSWVQLLISQIMAASGCHC